MCWRRVWSTMPACLIWPPITQSRRASRSRSRPTHGRDRQRHQEGSADRGCDRAAGGFHGRHGDRRHHYGGQPGRSGPGLDRSCGPQRRAAPRHFDPGKLAAAMLAGGTVLYSNPAGGSMEARIINDMLRRNAIFRGVKTRISLKGEGGEALVRGEGDMALQLVCEVLNHPEIELVGLVPVELALTSMRRWRCRHGPPRRMPPRRSSPILWSLTMLDFGDPRDWTAVQQKSDHRPQRPSGCRLVHRR